MKTRMLVVLGCWVAAGGCTPTLTPVFARQATPLTSQANPPRIIWVFDNSGSLEVPVDPAASSCTAGCGLPTNRCPPGCPTRKDLRLAGLDRFESAIPSSVTHAAVFYPSDALCGPPSFFDSNLSMPQLISNVAIRAPIGGSPTGPALRYVASLPQIAQAETFVVLLTDGLPNCNSDNPFNVCSVDPADAGAAAEALQACRCTTATCWPAVVCAQGCLDELATVAASHQLVEHEMRLMVVALGSDIALGPSIARSSLASMEIDLGPACTSEADCEGRACGADGFCVDKLYVAPAAADFEAPARRLADAVQRSARCTWWLPRQVTAAELTVELGGAVVSPTEWTLEGSAEQRVVLSGAACERLLATEEAPTISWLPPAE